MFTLCTAKGEAKDQSTRNKQQIPGTYSLREATLDITFREHAGLQITPSKKSRGSNATRDTCQREAICFKEGGKCLQVCTEHLVLDQISGKSQTEAETGKALSWE